MEIKREKDFENKLQVLKTQKLKDSMLWYLGKSKPILTTAGVIAEMHGLAQKSLKGISLSDFWGFAQNTLRELGLEEELVRLLAICQPELKEFYPVDTSLVELARQHLAEPRRILLSDRKLAGYCRKNEIPFIWIDEVDDLWHKFAR